MEGHPEDIASDDDQRTVLTCTLSPNFEDVLETDAFVDKSGLILAVLQKEKVPVVLCTAPRRFGKTVNLSMMQRFLELEVDENGEEKTTVLEEKDNYKLFNSARFKLKVMDNKKFVKTYFGQYPIININFLCSGYVKRQSDAVDVCRGAISQAFRQHRYLYESTLSPLENDEKNFCEQWCDEFTYEGIPDHHVVMGLALLAEFLNKFHKKKVFLLVDDYDSIISNALYNVKDADQKTELAELESTAKFPIEVIGYALKTCGNVFGGAFITGILNILVATSNLMGNVIREQFGTNNLYQDFYGFTEDEVLTLFDRFSVDEELKKKAMAKYNGYINGDKKLCNPQTVVQFLINLALGEGALQNYWRQSSYIQNLYEEDSVRTLLYELLQGVKDFGFYLEPFELSDLKTLHNLLIHSNATCDDETIVVNFLVSFGYLTSHDGKLQIPNGELIDVFTDRLRNYFFGRYGINCLLDQDCSRSFSKLAIFCDEDVSLADFKEELSYFKYTMTCLLQKSTIIIDPPNVATLQAIIKLTCAQIGNYGFRIDTILYNDKSGIIVELKCQPQTVEDALKQIFKSHYCNVFTMTEYFNDRQKAPPLSLVMGIHVDPEKKASVLCLRRKDIIDVLDDLKVEAEPSLENRIEIAVNSMGERLINTFCERAIRG